jgi:predicted AlkP superfamily phosphohydrolase/phosphomutase
MKKFTFILSIVFLALISSCGSSQSIINTANGYDLAKYKYVVFSANNEGDAELDDILMMLENDISEKLQAVSPETARVLISQGENVLSPKINIKTEKWDGGETYISITFYDYYTNRSVAVIKSSGMGISISQDQEIAYKAIKKELNKVFNSNSQSIEIR